jgi:hypothetical protein
MSDLATESAAPFIVAPETNRYIRAMSDFTSVPTQKFTAEELLQHFTSTGYDIAELEHFFVDLVLHYLYPTDDWEVTPRRTRETLDKACVFLDLLKGVGRR